MEFNITEANNFINEKQFDYDMQRYCGELSMFMSKRSYSKVIKIICITFVIVPNNTRNPKLWNEEDVFCSQELGVLRVFKDIDYEMYSKSTMQKRKEMVVEGIAAAIDLMDIYGNIIDVAQLKYDSITYMKGVEQKNDITNLVEQLNRYELETHGEGYFERVPSMHAITEIIDLLENEGVLGYDCNFLVLKDKKTDTYIQAYWTHAGYHVEVPKDDNNGRRDIFFTNKVSKSDVIKMFVSFLNGKPISWDRYSKM